LKNYTFDKLLARSGNKENIQKELGKSHQKLGIVIQDAARLLRLRVGFRKLGWQHRRRKKWGRWDDFQVLILRQAVRTCLRDVVALHVGARVWFERNGERSRFK